MLYNLLYFNGKRNHSKDFAFNYKIKRGSVKLLFSYIYEYGISSEENCRGIFFGSYLIIHNRLRKTACWIMDKT